MEPKRTFYISRHKPVSQRQIDEMQQISLQLGGDGLLTHIRNFDNNRLSKAKEIPEMPMGSILFLIGTAQHYQGAIKKGFKVLRPVFAGKNRAFKGHQILEKCEVIWHKVTPVSTVQSGY